MATKFVFESLENMCAICGANDSNISYIEELLGCTLHVKGNGIECFDTGADTEQKFIILLEKLQNLCTITNCIEKSQILMEYKSVLQYSTELSSRIYINVGTKSVYPKTSKQRDYITAMKNSQIIFALGPAGTGKTFLAVNYALGLLFSGKIQKMILTRPVVEAGESLGFLPGDLSQKLNPYLKPLYDSMEATVSPATIKRLEETGQIEISPLAYMRGRSLNNCCVILDEAQNTTKGQMKMFLTRLGENSSAFITGDLTQMDLPKPEFSGLLDAKERLYGIDGISFIEFLSSDAVRSRIVQKIIEAYNEKK